MAGIRGSPAAGRMLRNPIPFEAASGVLAEAGAVVANLEARASRPRRARGRADPDAARARVRRVLDGVLDQRLEHEARDVGRARADRPRRSRSGCGRESASVRSPGTARGSSRSCWSVTSGRVSERRLERRRSAIRTIMRLARPGSRPTSGQERIQSVEEEVGLQLGLEGREPGLDDRRPQSARAPRAAARGCGGRPDAAAAAARRQRRGSRLWSRGSLSEASRRARRRRGSRRRPRCRPRRWNRNRPGGRFV